MSRPTAKTTQHLVRGRTRTQRLRLLQQGANEAELIELAQQGNGDAFEQLIAVHEHSVTALCQTLVRSSADVDDARQETLQALWRGLPGFEGRNSAQLSTWLYRVCTNAVTGLYRRPNPEPVGEPSETLEATTSGPEAITVSRQVTRWALNQLPDDFRVALVLADQLGMKYREIAEIQYVSESTVKTRIFRARQAMRHLLEAADA